ncbi:MAG TPA: hypothetical protein PKD15_04035 [Candidatus Saccharibacteria bacterium]|jgi:hypothetical protein|nr:hypothetical protein [Candidatus Saccharibacteria bacterium]
MSDIVIVDDALEKPMHIDRIAETVDTFGVAVMGDAISREHAYRIRREVRNQLVASIPLRALRLGSERLLGRENTPDFLQRRPYAVDRADARKCFSEATVNLLESVDELNVALLANQALSKRFDGRIHKVSTLILNRFSPFEKFEAHQDSVSNSGLSYIFQTSPSLWNILPEGPRLGQDPLQFITNAGDIVVMSQSKDGTQYSNRHQGFHTFLKDGSVVHEAQDVLGQNRFTLALFSKPA